MILELPSSKGILRLRQTAVRNLRRRLILTRLLVSLCTDMYYLTMLARFILIASLLPGCGQFDNSAIVDILGHADSELGTPPPCVVDHPLASGSHVVGPGVLGAPYVGFLRAVAPPDDLVRWTASELPDGLSLDPDTARISGIPTASGWLRATAVNVECSDASIDVEQFIDVTDPCADPATCPAADCTEITHQPLRVEVKRVSQTGVVSAVGPGESLAVDGATLRSNRVLPAGSPTTHQMIFSIAGSKEEVLVDYTLPGGPFLPIRTGEARELRYLHGEDGDRYFFLSRVHLKVFVIYDGYLPAAELLQRCPGAGAGKCLLGDLSVVPVPCEVPGGCADRETLALDMPEAAPALLLPGDSEDLESQQLTRLVSAWQPPPDGCAEDAWPYHLSFYQLRPALCTVAEAVVLSGPQPAAPTQAHVDGRVLTPDEEPVLNCVWNIEMPDVAAPVTRWTETDTDTAFEMPLVGDYQARVTCTGSHRNNPVAPCENQPAEVALSAAMATQARVELFWTQGGPDVPITMTVAGVPAKPQGTGGRVLALDLAKRPALEAIEITHESAGEAGAVQVVLRVLEAGEEPYRAVSLLPPATMWQPAQ